MTFALVTQDELLATDIAPVMVEAQAVIISTQAGVEAANERRKIIKGLMQKVEDAFGEPQKKAHETWKLLVARKKEHMTPLEEAYDLYGKKIGVFVQEEEVKRLAEQRRQEDELRKRQAAELARIEKKTAALLEKAGGLDGQIVALQSVLDDPDTPDNEGASIRAKLSVLLAQRDRAAAALAAQESRVQQVVAAPVPVYAPPAPKVMGMSTRTVKKGEVVNKLQMVMAVASGSLPLELLDVNPTALGKLIAAGMMLPGVTVREERIVATRR